MHMLAPQLALPVSKLVFTDPADAELRLYCLSRLSCLLHIAQCFLSLLTDTLPESHSIW